MARREKTVEDYQDELAKVERWIESAMTRAERNLTRARNLRRKEKYLRKKITELS